MYRQTTNQNGNRQTKFEVPGFGRVSFGGWGHLPPLVPLSDASLKTVVNETLVLRFVYSVEDSIYTSCGPGPFYLPPPVMKHKV